MNAYASTPRLYDVNDLENTLVLGRNPKGSDIDVLQKYLEPLKQGRLTPSAVLRFGQHIEVGDVRYMQAFISVVKKLLSDGSIAPEDVRLRHWDDLRGLEDDCDRFNERWRMTVDRIKKGDDINPPLKDHVPLIENDYTFRAFLHKLDRLVHDRN
jgi:hypothetical protein